MSRKNPTPKERHHTIEDLVAPFGWNAEVPDLTDTEHRKLYQFLKATIDVDLQDPGAQLQIPPTFWMCVVMPKRVLPTFSNSTDARALAIAACQTFGDLLRWRRAVVNEDLQEQISYFLHDCVDGKSTSAGDVYTDMKSRAIWFGRKAGKAPAFSDDRTYAAFDVLFNVARSATTPTPKPAKPKAAKVIPRATVKPTVDATELRTVPLSHLQPSKENHRKVFDKKELQELADSIKAHGVLQPLLIRPLNDGSSFFVIIAGERRYRAALLAGLKEVPTQIVTREGLSESLAMLHENIMRVDLNPIERAEAIKRMMTDHGVSQAEVGKVLGVQQGQISNTLRLLNLPEALRKLVADGKIAPTFIRAILPYCDLPAVMDDVAKIFVKRLERPDAPDGRIEMRDVENWIRTAVVNHSRPMKYQAHWSDYSNPSPKDRHFSKVSDENLKLLAPRKIDVMNEWEGKERTFNVKLFDELNKTPLANRREKHKAYKAKRDQSSGPAKAGGKTEKPFEHEWKVEHLLQEQMSKLLADGIESTKPSTMRQKLHAVVLTLAISSGESIIDEIAGHKTHFRKRVSEAATKLDCSPAECDRFLQSIVIKELRDSSYLDCSTAIALAKMLGVDLVTAWAPNDELRNTLTDHGRQLLAEAEPGVPDFLLPFFGIEKKTPKAKKGKAA